mgnify:CR=1 FL=1
MIITPFKNKFNILKSSGIHIQYVLDIGAYRGDFTDTIKSVWPSAIVTQFEADDRQSSWLSANAIIGLLGDVDGKEVDFFTLPPDKITTGSSIFKELTNYYTDNTTIVIEKEMTTIDSLNDKHNFFGNWQDNGLIKLDTQGSELLILNGAKNFLETKKPKFILLECSWLQYNEGSPLFLEVINHLDKLKYKAKDIFDMSYDNKGNLIQTDILFERKQ